MTSACQRRGGEVTPSAYEDDSRRLEEWGRRKREVSFPGEDGQHREDEDNEAIVNKVNLIPLPILDQLFGH